MDPVTHALVGAAAGHAVAGRRLGRAAMAIGAVSALAPDLDVLIRSQQDPLLLIEYHRHFTHALAFAPLGGAAAGLPWLVVRRLRERWGLVLLAAIAAYATHGVLDASTSFGTLLWWPFSLQRVAWHANSIIDPVFTLLVAIGVGAAGLRARVAPSVIVLAGAAAYLGMGALHRERARSAQEELASVRGHALERGIVLPTVGNRRIWRSLYEDEGRLHFDRLRVPRASGPGVRAGSAVPIYRQSHLPDSAARDPRIARDLGRWRWMTDGWLAPDPADPTVAADARYSLREEAFQPVWAVRFRPGERVATEWLDRSRERELRLRALWGEIRHGDGYRPLGSDRQLWDVPLGEPGQSRDPPCVADSAPDHRRPVGAVRRATSRCQPSVRWTRSTSPPGFRLRVRNREASGATEYVRGLVPVRMPAKSLCGCPRERPLPPSTATL
jgi:inner membrane protein